MFEDVLFFLAPFSSVLADKTQALLSDRVRLVRRVATLLRKTFQSVRFASTSSDSNEAYGTFAVRLKSLLSVRQVSTEDQL